jgi:hypothetical protein
MGARGAVVNDVYDNGAPKGKAPKLLKGPADLSFVPRTLSLSGIIRQNVRILDDSLTAFFSVELARAIPRSSLWIVPNAGHGPVPGSDGQSS